MESYMGIHSVKSISMTKVKKLPDAQVYSLDIAVETGDDKVEITLFSYDKGSLNILNK